MFDQSRVQCTRHSVDQPEWHTDDQGQIAREEGKHERDIPIPIESPGAASEDGKGGGVFVE